jgi:phosphoribosylanthranilate isomerase
LDTKSKAYGGAGRKFDWSLLKAIDKKTPKKYFLAGGIHPNDAKAIKALQLKNIIGLDLNSQFESSPGLKNVEELKTFLVELRS